MAVPSAAQTDFWPRPLEPEDNQSTPAKISLGARLFSDPRLSSTGDFSCASCHDPDLHFTDGRITAIGATGETHTRNTPTLYNVAFHSSYGWDDQGLSTLEAQHLVPLTNTTPVEMGFAQSNLQKLREDPSYRAAFGTAFGATQITLHKVVQALASYVRSIRAPQSAFDRYLFFDDASALSPAAMAGMELFFSPRLGCGECHASINFSGPISHSVTTSEPVFHVTRVGGKSSAFRAPTLRMIAHTAPYMHDGSLVDLEAVLVHYENSDAERVPDFSLSAAERRALIAFLQAL
ncbi:MAG: cytochrome c peroxidase [Pseudomonadota bacterium]